MRRHFLTRLLAMLPLGWLTLTARGSYRNFAEAPTMTPDASDPVSMSFALDTLKQKQAQENLRYLRFIDVSTLSMGLYTLPAGVQDTQNPHEEDEVYIITEGKAMLDVEGEKFPAAHGSILFVKARAKHHFYDIEEDLTVLVLFSKKKPF